MPIEKPVIAITMGDASGIGPEIIAKVLSMEKAYGCCRPFVVGDPEVMRQASRVAGTELRVRQIGDLSEARFSFSEMDVLCPEGVQVHEIRWGRLDPAMGRAAALCLEAAFKMALDKEVDGVVSAPLNKEAFHRAGYNYLDELEYLAELTESAEPFTMGVIDSVWTVAVTSHVPFRDIAAMIKKDRVVRYLCLMNDTLRKIGVQEPMIAVAALNVHGGEGGLCGREEVDEIIPAIEEARKLGLRVEGPFPGDTLFLRVMDGGFAGVVCMYHDQANIARKLLARRKGATLLMGLPVPVGTTAHGTAFDIAGKGIADPGSLSDALRYTAKLCSQREQGVKQGVTH
ncbi:MAG: 4-hydroxythreonine-4-phosphate dehydrogenase PdxA [Deltaproteobacteria bacterium]|nr:4-hydroxythreonine-4-phosphate dehydrogenase PdxA [Deltaproteobacteria bacterium]